MKKVVFLCLFIAGTFAISSCTSNLEQVETINLDRETVFADSAYTARFLSQIYTNVGYDVKPNRYKTEFMGWVLNMEAYKLRVMKQHTKLFLM